MHACPALFDDAEERSNSKKEIQENLILQVEEDFCGTAPLPIPLRHNSAHRMSISLEDASGKATRNTTPRWFRSSSETDIPDALK